MKAWKICVALTIIALSCLVFADSARADWNFAGWSYRKSHNITGSTAGAQTGYQISITVYNTTGTDSGGNVYIGTKARADFGDIRFVGNDDITLLDYWIESFGTNYAKFWVELPNIPTSPSSTTIYMYYGNAGASSTANGNETFYWFDNCSSASGWTLMPSSAYGSISSNGGILTVSNTTGNYIPRWYKNATFPTTWALAARTRTAATGASYADQTCLEAANSSLKMILENSIYPNGELSPNYHYYSYISGGVYNYPSTRPSPAVPTLTWFILQLKSNSTTKTMAELRTDSWGAWDSPSSTHDTANPTAVEIGTVQGTAYFDWIFVRKFVEPEPANGAWSSEESPGMVGYWKFDEGAGTSAADSSGYGNDGILKNQTGSCGGTACPSWTTGRFGSALSFDGVGDYVDLGNPASFPNGTMPRTMCAWVKPNSLSSGGYIFFYGSRSNNQAMYIAQSGTAGQLMGGAWASDIYYNNFFSVGTWSFVCLVYNVTHGVLYGNGAYLNSTGASSWSLVRSIAQIDVDWQLNHPWVGTIDEVMLFNYALSASEVLNEYQSIPPTTTTSTSTTTGTTTTTSTSTTTTTTLPAIPFTSFSFLTKPSQMNVNWATDYSGGTSVSVECRLNGAQLCSYVGAPGGGGCTIVSPSYNTTPESGQPRTVSNQLNCTAYDTIRPNIKNSNIVNFYPRAIIINLPSAMSLTVGDKQNLLITIENNGTLSDGYTVFVTPAYPNLLNVTGGAQSTQGLDTNDVQQIYSVLTLMTTGQTVNANVVVSSISQPAIQFAATVPVRGTQKSLPEFDVFGLLQIMLISALFASFLF